MIPRSHPLAAVGGAFNAVFVEADAAGQLMFYGAGAGGSPTASAVLGDIVAVGRGLVAQGGGGASQRDAGGESPGSGVRRLTGLEAYAELPVRPIGEVVTRYHTRLEVADRPGVLAAVATAFASHDVSIATVHQTGRGDDATLVIVTHGAPDAALSATVDELRALPIVRSVASVVRVEGE
jgi:homoserine dehydrogenase